MPDDPKVLADLLPCPFCGGRPKSYWQGDSSEAGDDGYWAVECCIAFAHECDQAEAITAWNTRTSPVPDRDERLGYERRILAAECGTQRVLNELRDWLGWCIQQAEDAMDPKAAQILRNVKKHVEEIDVLPALRTSPVSVQMEEAVAIALFKSRHPGGVWSQATDTQHDLFGIDARAAIAALSSLSGGSDQ